MEKVSVHGGHSGQFCHHAKDPLEAVVQAYIEQGFTWVGITEHMPPLNDAFRYADEEQDELSTDFLQQRFREYFTECRRLQAKYADKIELFTAFETETYPGAFEFVEQLIEETRPDYIVGSVHHVGNIGIDFSAALYAQAVEKAGSLEALYCQYFDAQYEMLTTLKPAVVGHFDLVRIFDPDFRITLQLKPVQQRIRRNLDFMAEHALIMDFNLRGYYKGEEAYPCREILEQAISMSIPIAPGDDSHGVSSVGLNYKKGVELLNSLGLNNPWPRPQLLKYEPGKSKKRKS